MVGFAIHPHLSPINTHSVGCKHCIRMLTSQANNMQVQCGHAEADSAGLDVYGYARSPAEARRRAVYMAVQFQVRCRATQYLSTR